MSPNAGQFPTATIVMIIKAGRRPNFGSRPPSSRHEANDRYGVVNCGMYDGRGLVLLNACHFGATTLDRSTKAVDGI